VNLSEPLDGYQLNLFCCKKDRAELLAAAEQLVWQGDIDSKFEDREWQPFVEQFAYGKAQAETWERIARLGGSEGWEEYERALNAYARSRMLNAPPSSRLGALQLCYLGLAELINRRGNLPRLLSFARVAAELGYRQQAVAALRQLIGNIQHGGTIYAGEPFLAPSMEFESVEPGNNIGNWIVAAVLDAYERRRTFSSYFFPKDTPFFVSKLAELGFCLPEMKRRLDLVSSRFSATQSA